MSNRILIDSSILIEYRKGAKTEMLEDIIKANWEPLICQPVVSEYLFFHIAIFSNKSPLSVKEAKEIDKYLKMGDPTAFLSQFDWLQDSADLFRPAIGIMEKYNLLPNDALIVSSCIAHDIEFLASYDSDFTEVCEKEGIQLIESSHKFSSVSSKDDLPF
jgi:uncharacterized protein